MVAAEDSEIAADIVNSRAVDYLRCTRIVAHDLGAEDGIVSERVVAWFGGPVIVGLCDTAIEFDDVIRRDEHLPVQVRRVQIAQIAVAHHQVSEGVGLQLIEEIRALRA